MNSEKTMHDVIKTFILNEKIKNEELLLTVQLAKKKDGGLNKLLIQTIKYSGKCSNEHLAVVSDSRKSPDETSLEFHFQKYCNLVILSSTYRIDISEYIADYEKKKQQILTRHQYSVWLDNNCEYGEYATIATHVSKLTHSSNRGSCLFDRVSEKEQCYLSTSSIHKPIADGTYESAKYALVAKLLLIENNGRCFYEDIVSGQFDGLKGFEVNPKQLQKWQSQLQKAVDQKINKTDRLSKQIYFPVKTKPSEKEDWHLLSVLVSSSLAQDLFIRLSPKENVGLVAKYQSKSLYSEDMFTAFPRRATLMVTQSSHQNSSILNGKRSGTLFLLPSHPPMWENSLEPPVRGLSWFDRGVPLSAIEEDLKHLRNFFVRFEKLALSTREPKKQAWLNKCGNRILSTVVFYAESIQNLPPGWSSTPGIKLKPAHQYFLDPYRADSTFQNAKQAADWQNIVATDFARWLNKKIRGKDKKFTPQAEHTKLWIELMGPYLREQNTMVKAVLAHTKEELV